MTHDSARLQGMTDQEPPTGTFIRIDIVPIDLIQTSAARAYRKQLDDEAREQLGVYQCRHCHTLHPIVEWTKRTAYRARVITRKEYQAEGWPRRRLPASRRCPYRVYRNGQGGGIIQPRTGPRIKTAKEVARWATYWQQRLGTAPTPEDTCAHSNS